MTGVQTCALPIYRFDADTKATFYDLYTKVDAGIDPTIPTESEVKSTTNEGEEVPF